MAVKFDPSKSQLENFYALLTYSTSKLAEGESLGAADVTMGEPTAVSGRDDGLDTAITITVVPTSKLIYGPEKTLYYHRPSIVDLLAANNVSLALTDELEKWDESHRVASTLEYINTGVTGAFTEADLSIGQPVVNGDNGVTVEVDVVSGHLNLVGTFTLSITGVETRASTDDVSESLGGFDKEGS